MPVPRLEEWRKVLELHLAHLGRDDIGVGEVSEADAGQLEVEFIKGGMRRTETIPVDALNDADQARAALNAALLRISKAVERQYIEAARKG